MSAERQWIRADGAGVRRLCVLAMLTVLASCAKDYNIELPANSPQLVVECYLEDGQPMRALVTESTALLDTALVPPIVRDAVVTITYHGRTDTLNASVYLDPLRNRAYNYGSATVVHADYQSGESYRIDVVDGKGRHASGTTRFIAPARISALESRYNADQEASVLTTIPDDPATKNFYRLVLKRNSQLDSIQLNSYFTDELANAAGNIQIRSRHRFAKGDSVYATLFHLTPEYYQFLNTSQGASSALGNPFAASGEVVSNISGGLGVFTALTYTERGWIVE